MDCQKALENKIIPETVCSDRDSWYAAWQLSDEYGLHPSTIRKLIRQGKLKPRVLTTKDGAIYYQLFIKEENKYLFSLKKSDKGLKVIINNR